MPTNAEDAKLGQLWGRLFQAHPWHGISPGPDAPEVVTAFVEIVPADAVKYELDKESGHLKVDRPQRYSSLPPTLYGFVPQSYCAERVAQLAHDVAPGARGDGDPLDLCILTERLVPTGNFLARVVPIGGLRLIDSDEADDKVVAVLEGDVAYGAVRELDALPDGLVERLEHYFLSYKQLPGPSPRKIRIAGRYGRAQAQDVIRRSLEDYRAKFGDPAQRFAQLRGLLRGE